MLTIELFMGSLNLTIAYLRQLFWTLNVRDLIRKISLIFVVCIRHARPKKHP